VVIPVPLEAVNFLPQDLQIVDTQSDMAYEFIASTMIASSSDTHLIAELEPSRS
jgi:hypothetical protein